MKGRQPLWPETVWRRYGRPAVKAANIQKRVGFHTFRHTYTTLLTQNNEEVKVVQELLRHANSRITLDLYAQAGMPNKRLAQNKLVRLVLNKGEALETKRCRRTSFGTKWRRKTLLIVPLTSPDFFVCPTRSVSIQTESVEKLSTCW
jgi:hypothetical protein